MKRQRRSADRFGYMSKVSSGSREAEGDMKSHFTWVDAGAI